MKRRLLVVAALACARAYGQPVAPVVQVKASADQLRQQDSAARIVITREEILKNGDSTVLDVLRRVPGVSVADGAPRMRGLGAGYTQVLLNGERPPNGFSLDNLAPDMIERIEVMRAATAEYSTQAIAGTINVVLRKTVAKPSQDMRAMLSASPRGGTSGLGGSRNGKQDDFSYTLGANLFAGSLRRPERDRIERPGSVRVDDGHVRDSWAWLNVNSRLNWTLAPGHTLGWQSVLAATAFRADRSTASEVLRGPAYAYAAYGYRRRDQFASLRSDISWARRVADGGRLESTAGVETSGIRRRRRMNADDASGTPTLARDYASLPGSQRLSWNGKFAWPAAPGHTVTLGWDAGYNQLREHEVQQEAPLAGQPPADFERRLRAGVTRLAAYAQDEWDINRQLSLYAGLRHEASRTRSSGSDFAPHKVRAAVSSPLLQGLYKLPGDSKRQLRAALTRTFRAPDTTQLAPRQLRSIANSEVDPDSSGNPDLRPEIARGIDLAYEHYWAEGAMWSLSAATRQISDVIIDSVQLQGERWVSAPHNRGSARVRSLEWELKLPAGPLKLALNLGRHWSALAQVPGPDNRLASQAPWSGNASIDYRSGPWGAGANVGYTGGGWSRQSASQSSYRNERRSVELFATWRPGASGLWRLTVVAPLRQDVLSASRYETADGRSESTSYRRTDRALRLMYEGPL